MLLALLFFTLAVCAFSCSLPGTRPAFDTSLAAADACRARRADAEALRILGEAGAAAKRVHRLPSWRLRDLEVRIATLETLRDLPPAARAQVAQADSLRALYARFRDGASPRCAAWAEEEARIRERILGPRHSETGEALSRVAQSLRRKGDYVNAQETGRNAEDILLSTVGEDHPATAANLMEQAVLLRLQRQWIKARGQSTRAVAIYSRTLGEESVPYARALTVHAGAIRDMGSPADARPMYDKALRIMAARSGRNSLEYAEALFTSGNCDLRLLHPERAERAFREALAITRRAPSYDPLQVAWMLHDLGTSLRQQRRLDEAAACYREALALRKSEAEGTYPLLVEDLRELTHIAQTQGRLAEADSLLCQAVDIYEKVRLHSGVGIARDLFYTSPYDQLAVNLLMQDRSDEAWPAAECAQGRMLSELLFSVGKRSLSLEQAALEDSLKREQSALEDSLRMVCDEETAARETLRARLAANEAQWVALEEDLVRDQPLLRHEGVSIDSVRAALAPRTALIGWVTASTQDDRLLIAYGYVITADHPPVWVALPHAGDALSTSRQMIATVRHTSDWPFRVREDERTRARGRQLWRSWFEPLEPRLKDIDQLIVLPSDVFMGLPLEVLVDSTGTWLADRWDISYMPSPALLCRLASDRAVAARPSYAAALLVGDPQCAAPDSLPRVAYAFDGEDAFGDAAGTLPNARAEIERIAKGFEDPTILTGMAASRERLRRMADGDELRRYDVMHFSTHIRADTHDPDLCGILLAPASGRGEAVLTAAEIIRDFHLRAEIVVLSGCSSGLGREVGRGGYLGLGSAFLIAGARSLIVSLWDVEDESTALLMEHFYRNLHAGMSRCAALARARRAVRDYVDDTGGTPYAHPVYWAGFMLMGDPR